MLAISEVPVMLGAAMLQRRLGNRTLLGIALCVYVIRFILIATLRDTTWLLAIMPLHALTYTLFLISSIRLVFDIAGRERAATMQSVLAATMAAGNVLGALVNGAVADALGIRAVFWVAAGANLLALAVFLWTRTRRNPN